MEDPSLVERVKAEVLFYIDFGKAKAEKEKVRTHTQVQKSDSRYSARVKRLRQIGAEMVSDS